MAPPITPSRRRRISPSDELFRGPQGDSTGGPIGCGLGRTHAPSYMMGCERILAWGDLPLISPHENCRCTSRSPSPMRRFSNTPDSSARVGNVILLHQQYVDIFIVKWPCMKRGEREGADSGRAAGACIHPATQTTRGGAPIYLEVAGHLGVTRWVLHQHVRALERKGPSRRPCATMASPWSGRMCHRWSPHHWVPRRW